MKRTFKIAHISDLHFGNTDADTLRYLVKDLSKVVRPDIVIVSGDIAERARVDLLTAAHTFLVTLARECHLSLDRIFVVPGNHDIRDVIGRVWPARKLEFYASSAFPLFSLDPVQLHRYLPEFNIAIFSFDSTIAKVNIAEGEVCSQSLLAFHERYENIIDHKNRHCYKLAVVHHHPLPIPHTSSDNFLLLRKAGDFIKILMAQEIDIVLYGHKHAPFFSTIQYNFDGKDAKLACIGAGSATQRGTHPNLSNSYNVIFFEGSKVTLEVRERRPQYPFGPLRSFRVFNPPEMPLSVFRALSQRIGYQVIQEELRLLLEPNGTEKITLGSKLEIARDWSFPFVRRQHWATDQADMEDVDFKPARSCRRKLSHIVEERSKKLYEGSVKSEVAPSDGMQFEYRTHIRQKGGFARTREEFDRKDLYDDLPGFGKWTSSEILAKTVTEPISKLIVSVKFAFKYDFKPWTVVLYDGKPEPELQRLVRNNFSFDGAKNVATLTLRRPRIGYTYAIAWVPMAEKEFSLERQSQT